MHLAYHQCYCDLYRVVLPGYQFPITKLFAGASIEFIQQCQERCYRHADAISKIFKSALSSEGSIFTEPLCGIFAYESTKIQVIFVTTYVGLNPGVFYDQIAENIETNLQSIEKAAMQQSKNAIFVRYTISCCLKSANGVLLDCLSLPVAEGLRIFRNSRCMETKICVMVSDLIVNSIQ